MLKILYIHIIDCRPFVTKFTTVTVIRNILSKVQFSYFAPKEVSRRST